MSANYHMIDNIHKCPSALGQTRDNNEGAVGALVERVRQREVRRLVLSGVWQFIHNRAHGSSTDPLPLLTSSSCSAVRGAMPIWRPFG